MIGRKVAHYEIVEQLGSGGMGEVFLAEDTRLSRKVALKFLAPELAQDHEALVRFQNEAKAAAELSHPNIATIYDIGEADGRHYLVLEYLRGQTLRERIAQSPLTLEEVLRIGRALATGLAEAHAHGIVHRDIKSANVMITERREVKILDFGLARRADDTHVTRVGTAVGTVAYMSPEQLRGFEADARSDLWSLGVCLFECVTGSLPFHSQNPEGVTQRILHDAHAPMSTLRYGVPPELDRIVEKCLQKDPALRYRDAEDLGVDLDLLAVHESSSGRPLTVVQEPHGIRVRGMPWFLAGLLALAVLAVVMQLRPDNRAVSSPPAHTQMTFGGNAYYPKASPDGNFLAWIEFVDGGTSRLMLMDLLSGNKAQLFSAGEIRGIEWTADGGELLVLACAESGFAVTASARGCALNQVSRLGGPPRKLMAATSMPVVSPDGSEWAWIEQGKHLSISYVESATRDTLAVRSLIEPLPLPEWRYGELQWSPDGSWLVFVASQGSSGNEHGIWVLPAHGERARRLVQERQQPVSIDFSPDGRFLYYLRSEGALSSLMKIEFSPTRAGDGATAAKVLEIRNSIGSHMLDIDRPDRLFTVEAIFYSNLVEFDPESDGPPAIWVQGATNVEHPALSPDQRWLAYTNGDSWKTSNLFVKPIDGGEERQLTFSSGELNEPFVWLPDSSGLRFVRDGAVWKALTDGGEPELVFRDEDCTVRDLSYSPAAEIYCRCGDLRNGEWIGVDPGTRAQRPLLPADSARTIWVLRGSPDGTKFAFHGMVRGSRGLWLFDLADSTYRLLVPGAVQPSHWSNDGEWVYAVAAEPNNNHAIIKAPISGAPAIKLMITGDEGLWGVAKLPGSEKFVAARVEFRSDIWKIENFDAAPQ